MDVVWQKRQEHTLTPLFPLCQMNLYRNLKNLSAIRMSWNPSHKCNSLNRSSRYDIFEWFSLIFLVYLGTEVKLSVYNSFFLSCIAWERLLLVLSADGQACYDYRSLERSRSQFEWFKSCQLIFKKKINQMIKDLYVFINGIKIYLSPLHPV